MQNLHVSTCKICMCPHAKFVVDTCCGHMIELRVTHDHIACVHMQKFMYTHDFIACAHMMIYHVYT